MLPPAPTLLDKLVEQGGEVISIGKIADIYAHCGISKSIKEALAYISECFPLTDKLWLDFWAEG